MRVLYRLCLLLAVQDKKYLVVALLCLCPALLPVLEELRGLYAHPPSARTTPFVGPPSTILVALFIALAGGSTPPLLRTMSTDDVPASVNETASEVGNGISAMLALSEQVLKVVVTNYIF